MVILKLVHVTQLYVSNWSFYLLNQIKTMFQTLWRSFGSFLLITAIRISRRWWWWLKVDKGGSTSESEEHVKIVTKLNHFHRRFELC